MSWTTVSTNSSWQSLALAQEIAAAYNLRAFVAGVPTIESRMGVSSINEDILVSDFIYQCQSGIEAMYPSFANPNATLTGQSSVLLPYASAQALFSAAGIPREGGWRRIIEGYDAPSPWTSYFDQAWNYGKLSDRDEAGPWLFRDLQLALSAMKRMVFSVSIQASSSKYQTISKTDTSTTGWNVNCNSIAGNVSWPSSGNYGSNLITAAKTLQKYYSPNVYWSSMSSATMTSKLYASAMGFDYRNCGGASWTFILLLSNDSGSNAFSSVTGFSSSDPGSTKDIGNNGGATIGSTTPQPCIYLPVYHGSSTPSWQSLIDVVPTPSGTDDLITEVRHLSVQDLKLVMDFTGWLN